MTQISNIAAATTLAGLPEAASATPAVLRGRALYLLVGLLLLVQILDDQWLKTLVETGIIGVFGWLWLFFRSTISSCKASLVFASNAVCCSSSACASFSASSACLISVMSYPMP